MRTFLRIGSGQSNRVFVRFFICLIKHFFDELSNVREENVSYYN